MNYYQKTSYNFLWWSFFPVTLYFLCFGEEYFITGKLQFHVYKGISIMLICYFILAASVAFQVHKARNLAKEIITYGFCYDGVVDKVIETLMETTFIKTGMDTKTAYYLQVSVSNDSGLHHIFYSDIIFRYMKNHIEKNVKIYVYMGKTFVLLQKSKKTNRFAVERRIDIEKISLNRIILNWINYFCATALIVIIVLFPFYT